jgi:8-oxo-dGTP pyrophosphatase MutT (NUDIX family)
VPPCNHLATGIIVNDGRLLMVASRYPNQPQPLWNLPGGRQLSGELLEATVAREVLEETGLRVEPHEVAYVSESYDGETHFVNVAFRVEVIGERSFDCAPLRHAQGRCAQDDTGDVDHVVAVEWVPIEELRERIVVAVVREPLLAFLNGALPRRYAGFHEAGITIEWPQGSS